MSELNPQKEPESTQPVPQPDAEGAPPIDGNLPSGHRVDAMTGEQESSTPMVERGPEKGAGGEDEGILEKTARAFGTNAEEAAQLGAVDRADRGVELTFAEGRRTEDSPASKALWGQARYEMFASSAPQFTPEQAIFRDNCIEVVQRDMCLVETPYR